MSTVIVIYNPITKHAQVNPYTVKHCNEFLALPTRHFSVTPYITICPSTETYLGHYLRGAMSAVTGIYLYRLLLNIIFLSRDLFLPLQTVHTMMKCRMLAFQQFTSVKNMYQKYIFHN